MRDYHMTRRAMPIRALRLIWREPPRVVVRLILRAAHLLPQSEQDRLLAYPRYTRTTARLLGRTIEIADSASYLFMRREIFDSEIYRFETGRERPLIIDCGANIGLSVVYFKLLHPQATVLAFEPDRELFALLARNVATFGLTDVELHEKAVWSESTRLDFFHEGADGGRIAALNDDSESIQQVETVRLRDLLDRRVDLLKLDVDGAEQIVLEDCRDSLENVERVFVEVHCFSGRPQGLGELLSLL